MCRDWNIVDDEIVQEVEPDDARLNRSRVRLIALERRAANRSRQWAVGAAGLAFLTALALFFRAAGWIAADVHHAGAVVAILIGVVFLCAAMRAARRILVKILQPLKRAADES